MDLTSVKSGFPRRKCGVLGCTGSVGQRFALLLALHPHFDLVAVGASSRSAGKRYCDATAWKQVTPMARSLANLIVTDCEPVHFQHCDLVFSGLDSSVAGHVETAFRDAGIPTFSNAKNHRQDADIPLVVPTVNLSHLDLLQSQLASDTKSSRKGFLVCNSNCAVIGIVIPLAAIEAKCGPIDTVSIVTSQALSGAGYPGVSAMDILDNVVPFISGEEDKMEPEARKILGTFDFEKQSFVPRRQLRVSATCTRVNVTDGHMAFVSFRFKERANIPSAEMIKSALQEYVSEAQKMQCPSAPLAAITVLDQPDRPQPRLDRDADRGYSVSVGRVRHDPSGIFDAQFVALSHNTIIGAAGSSILNAEAAVLKGYV